jgi:hypothetical protein
MSLPRPPSVLDAALASATNPNLDISVAPTVVPTGAPKRAAEEMSPGGAAAEGCDLPECSDADFDTWLERQKPNLFAADPAFEHKRFASEMMQAWMTLTTAATEALVAFAGGTYQQSMPAVPQPEGPRFAVLSAEEPNYEAQQALWNFEQDQIRAHKAKAAMLLARARKVQAKISLV